MKGSTMKRQDMAVAAVTDIDGCRTPTSCAMIRSSISAAAIRTFTLNAIGLAHMSGIARTDVLPGDLVEPDRGLVFVGDRVGNIAQLRALQAAGYEGFVSMEPFSPEVQNDPELAAHLRASLEYVSTLLQG